jgi:hypothetical protein
MQTTHTVGCAAPVLHDSSSTVFCGKREKEEMGRAWFGEEMKIDLGDVQ